MWKHYFPRGLVYGLDIADKSPLDEPRVRTIRGDQSDPEFLAALADRVGPLDIVVDDGSHVSAHIITSFTTLFPKLPVGGLYVIEDLQTSYWPSWNGNRHDLNDPNTTMGFLKTLMDDLHRPERVEPAGTPIGVPGVTAVHLYRNIAFVEKGIDQEQPGPAWLRGA
jgi:demethylmacrocin O-methyltransferase